MLSRDSVLHPTLPVVLALFRMLSLTQYSEPELDPIWVVLWCITVAFLLFVIVCLECPPPRTDICITFKSSLMRGRFRWYQSRRLAVGCDPRSETLFLAFSH